MIKKLKAWFMEHLDYKIVGEYYDCEFINGVPHYTKKYNKKWYWRKK